MTKIFSTITIIFAIIFFLFVPADADNVKATANYSEVTYPGGETAGQISFDVINKTGKFIDKPVPVLLEKKVGDLWTESDYGLSHTDLGARIAPQDSYGDSAILVDGFNYTVLSAGEYRITLSYRVLRLIGEAEEVKVTAEFTVE